MLKKPPLFDKILEVCELVDLLDFIDSQTLRFDTMIEEGAANLSGGQKQRLAIARALLKDSEIIIFDEATSGMDTLLENKIVQNLMALKEKTIIFIAHQLNIAKYCDLILVMHDGELIERGSHEKLLNKNGMYKKLWEL